MKRFCLLSVLLTAQLCAVEVVRNDYTIDIPSDWEVGAGWTEDDVSAVAPFEDHDDLSREVVNVLVDEDVGTLTLEEYYNLSLNGLRVLATDFDLQGEGKVEIGGVEARYLLFTHRTGIYELKVLQYMLLVDHKAYIITGAATVDQFDQYKPIFEKIAMSFRLK